MSIKKIDKIPKKYNITYCNWYSLSLAINWRILLKYKKINNERFNNCTKPFKSYHFRSNWYYKRNQTIACLCTVITLWIPVYHGCRIVFPKKFYLPHTGCDTVPHWGCKTWVKLFLKALNENGIEFKGKWTCSTG